MGNSESSKLSHQQNNVALMEVICLQCTSNPNPTIYAQFLSDMCNSSVQPHFCFGGPNWGLSQTYVFSGKKDICSSGRGPSWLSSFDIHCVLLEYFFIYRRLMQCVQRVYNLYVSVDQQTRPYWKYSSAYCLWTWTGEVQKLLSTLSKTDTFQSSTRCRQTPFSPVLGVDRHLSVQCEVWTWERCHKFAHLPYFLE